MAISEDHCSIRRDVLGHVGNKWSALVLLLLADGPRRYSELRRSCRISQRMLTLTLRELQRDGLIARQETAYALSDAGRSLSTLVTSLVGWADRHSDAITGSRLSYDAASGA